MALSLCSILLKSVIIIISLKYWYEYNEFTKSIIPFFLQGMLVWEGHPGKVPVLHCHIWTAESPLIYPSPNHPHIKISSLQAWFKYVVCYNNAKGTSGQKKGLRVFKIRERLVCTCVLFILPQQS